MMPTKRQGKPDTDQEARGRQHLSSLIGGHVMHTLGQPGNLHSVQVRSLWEGHYRVNVLVGVDVASAKVAHSYFLVADGEGNIVTSTPRIARKY